MIRVAQVRVVDEEGAQMGVMSTADALRLAQDRGYDLVEVAPMASPPVTRLLDYGQFKYEQARREKEARRHQRSVDFKEIRFKVKIGRGDFETKVRRAIQFLEAGDRVKVTCQFRGRELSHAYLGRDLLIRFGEMIGEHGTLERQPLLEGKQMSIVIGSNRKPVVQAKPAEEEPAQPAATEAKPVAAAAAEPAATEAKPAAAKPAAAKPVAAKPAAAKPAAKAKPNGEEKPQTAPPPAARRKAAVGSSAKPAGG
jgi:translation initiation factor IF-3